MANEYLDQLQANADQTSEPANPYLDMLQSEQTGKTAALRGTLTSTTAVNPDQYAQKKRVAEYLGYPTATVEAQPHLETQARVKEIDQLTEGTPALRQKYTDPNFSKLAHDDADTLSKIESAIRNFGKAAMSGLYNANAGLVGVAQAPFDLAAPLLNPLVGTVLPENPLGRVASGLSDYRQGIEARAKMTTPQADNTVEAGWYSGVSSLAANTANLPLLFAGPAGQRAYMTAMVAPVGGQAYGQARDQGLSPTQAAVFGASQAAIEYGTEQLGLPALVGMLKPGKFGTKAIEYLIKEQGGEQIATALQDLNEWSTLPENKDRTFADYLRERPSAALQTAIATTVGGGGQVAVARVLQSAAGRIEQQRAMADQGEQGAQFLAGLDQLAAASKVRARDAGSFQEFIAQAAEDGPVDAVYISAQQLAQTDIVQQLAQVSPSVAQQLPEALATGGAIRIPVDEYATRIAGTELSQPLLDHLRTEPNGFSRAEAKMFMQNEGDQLQAEIEQQLATQQASDEFKAQADVVRNEIRTQLDTLGRFTPEANDSYAQVMGSFYAVTAAKLGVSPQELWAQYPISVQSGALGGQALEQGGFESLPRINAFGDLRIRKGRDNAKIQADSAYADEPSYFLKGVREVPLADIALPIETLYESEKETQRIKDLAEQIKKNAAIEPVLVTQDPSTGGLRLSEGQHRARALRLLGYTSIPARVALPVRALNQSTRTGAVTRQDLAWSATGQNANGPVFAGRNFILDPVKAIPVDDGDFAPGGMAELGIMGHAAHVTEGATPYVFSILRPNQQTAGQLVADVKDGEVVAIHDIEIYDKGKGLGADVVASIAANTEGPVKIVEALDQSEYFWRKLGLDGLDQYRNGSIDWSGASRYYTNRNGLADRSPRTAESGAGASDLAGSTGALEGFSARELSPEEIAALEAQGFKLHQAQQNQQARGSYTPDTGVITLMKQANLSTFLHESGHAFLDLQTKIANQLAAKDPAALTEGERSILKDTQAIMEWFGLRDLAEWNSLEFEQMRPLHERWARGFESYLFEGKAPNIELQGVFQRFRAWLLNIYRSAQALNVEITDDVRGVMDRMLATNEQIQIAERNRSMLPLFDSAQQAGMTEQEFADYQALGVDATNEAIQDLQARGLRDMQYIHNARGREIKRLQKESKARRAEVEMDVRREVMSEPVYQAWQFLTSEGEDGAPAGKIRIADVTGDDALWARMKKYKMTAADGMPADLVAERFGFTSGDHLIRALAEADTPQDAIEGLTDARMLEMYGELSSPEAIEREADKAIHSGVRVRMLATEANALAKATGQRKILTKAAKQFAETMIARLQIRAIRPTMYANAEARAAKNAADASRGGDLATAAAEKRNQIVQHYATRAAYDAQDEVERSLRYLRKFEKDSTRKNIDPDYADQIDAMLERFDLRRATTLKAIDKRTRLAAWLESQREQGLEPDIPLELQDEAFRKSYKEMTVEEFRGLVDSVRQIEHLGRLKNQLLTSKAIRDYQAVRDLLVASINENAGDRQAVTRTPATKLGKMAAGLRRFGANHIKAATWARIMDGGKDGGPMWEYMIRTANERGDMETQMRSDATVELSRIMTPVLKLGKMGGAGKFFPSVGRSFNRESLLAIALNTGNQGNLQRLLGGEGWTVDQVRPMLESLTAEEWRAVQSVWDYFETFRPQIAAKERRVYGKEPDWVEPQPFEIKTADGETVSVKGGYYPIKYDPVASERAESHADAEEARRQMQGAYTSATTRRSFTKSRVEEVSGRPLLYSLAGVYSGVNDVIHDLAWHEWLIDSNKLLRSQSIDNAIRSKYGPEVKQQFKKWVEDVAAGEARAEGAAAEAAGWLRRGISAAGLGFNATSAAMQVLGLNQSIVRVGPTWVARGIAQYIGHPMRSTREVTEKSKFMADRSRTQMRELNELRNRVEGQTKAGEILTGGTYFLMMRAQQMVDVPTWMGAYEKAIAEGNDEERAIALSDQAVIDAQGSGMVKDLAAIERGGPVSKLFTVFYSFMNTALNAGVSVGMTEKNKGKLAAQMLMLYTVPAVLGALMKDAITPGGGDDDDLEKLARKLAAEQLSYLMGLFVFAREFQDAAKIITGAEGARDYSGPAGTRLVGDSLKFMNQAKQGEFDDAFRKSSINLLGDFTGLPAAQINRTWTGINALSEGETDNPGAVLFGYQKQ